jgi:hypothetical protein
VDFLDNIDFNAPSIYICDEFADDHWEFGGCAHGGKTGGAVLTSPRGTAPPMDFGSSGLMPLCDHTRRGSKFGSGLNFAGKPDAPL